MSAPLLVLTQGDPAGVGPEILLRAAARCREGRRLVLVAERAALEAASRPIASENLPALEYFDSLPEMSNNGGRERPVAVFDPVRRSRRVKPGRSGPEDAAGALACLDAGIELVRERPLAALITAPVSKESIARHVLPDFVGHTDYLAARCGMEGYGRDYLMAFLAEELQVALVTTHLPLQEAVQAINETSLSAAIRCLARNVPGRIAVAGLNPHAGEGGLLGDEEERIISPAVAACREEGVDVHGPESADSLFVRARRGEFDWVLALYHDQGLIPVKTLAFGSATNWTLGLPFLRTSVDHGTAFEIAGRGMADARPLLKVIETTQGLLEGRLPRQRH